MRGTVKWFNNSKGYGFIIVNGFKDIFVHYSKIKSSGYKSLKDGEPVYFTLIRTPKGLQALDVVKGY